MAAFVWLALLKSNTPNDAGAVIWTVSPVIVSIAALALEYVVIAKGDTIRVLVGFLQMPSKISSIFEPAAMAPPCAMFVKLI